VPEISHKNNDEGVVMRRNHVALILLGGG